MKTNRSTATVAVSLLLFAALAAACSRQVAAEPDSRAAPVEHVVAVAKGRTDIDGGLIRLAASRDGIVRELLVGEGETVRAGQPLALLDDRPAALALAVATCELGQAESLLAASESRLRSATRELARLGPLAAGGHIGQLELDRARDNVDLANADVLSVRASIALQRARLDVARLEVEQRTVCAPTDGTIVRRLARPGDGVSTLNVTGIFLFAPAAPRIVRAEIDERFALAVRVGMKAAITIEIDEQRRYAGQVIRLGRVFGLRTPTEDATERQDMRVLECVLSISGADDLPLGQRVIVRIDGEPSSKPAG